MTPMEMLDAAIAAGDLEAIVEARQLMAAAAEAPIDGEDEPVRRTSHDIPDDDGGGGDTRIQCAKRPIDKKPRKNKFKDGNQAIADTKEDKLLTKNLMPRAARESSRPAFKKVKATCRECRQDYMVDPTMVIIDAVVEGERISYLCSK